MRCIRVLIGAVALLAWTATAQDYGKIEGYMGYTYVHFYSQNVVPSLSLNGGSAQFAYNFNRWFSTVLDAGAVTNSRFGGFNIDNTQVFFMAGPRLSLRRKRFRPYVQAVFGGVYYTASTQIGGLATEAAPFLPLPGDNQVTARLQTSQTKFAMAVGGGLDLKLTRWLSFRPGSVDYYYTRIGDFRGLGDNSQNNIRYTAGLNFMFGGEQAVHVPAPQTKTCPDGSTIPADQTCPKMNLSVSLAAAATEVCPGETVQIVPTVAGANPSMVGFQWSVNGQNTVQGQNFGFSTAGLQPGTYNIKVSVGGPQFNTASAETSVTVKPYIAPTATVNASPTQIYAGDRSTVTATCSGQCGGTLRPPTFTASEGSIQGDQFDSSGVNFDPSNNAEQRKTVTITAACADDKNVGNGTAQIEVVKKATIAPIRLPDILFSRDSARVNNCGKRILLEQLRSYYERDSGGSVALVGHQSSDEKPANLSEERSLNAAAVITAGSGVCLSIPASRVQVSSPGTDQMGVSFDSNFCQSSVAAGPQAEARRVVVWFIPSGGQMPTSVTNAQAASALSVGNLGCPK
jgi:outer membrane protein OmpA-like peptidoglycan-associated protein/opacity protein-like surface antigen